MVPTRGPDRPFIARYRTTTSACPVSIAEAARPTRWQGACPPKSRSTDHRSPGTASVVATAWHFTESCITMKLPIPSTSAPRKPASTSASADAARARSSTDRPESRENGV